MCTSEDARVSASKSTGETERETGTFSSGAPLGFRGASGKNDPTRSGGNSLGDKRPVGFREGALYGEGRAGKGTHIFELFHRAQRGRGVLRGCTACAPASSPRGLGAAAPTASPARPEESFEHLCWFRVNKHEAKKMYASCHPRAARGTDGQRARRGSLTTTRRSRRALRVVAPLEAPRASPSRPLNGRRASHRTTVTHATTPAPLDTRLRSRPGERGPRSASRVGASPPALATRGACSSASLWAPFQRPIAVVRA